MSQIIIVVSKDNTLIDCGEPGTFILWKILNHLADGHIIRQISKEDFEQSPLKPR